MIDSKEMPTDIAPVPAPVVPPAPAMVFVEFIKDTELGRGSGFSRLYAAASVGAFAPDVAAALIAAGQAVAV